MSVRLKRIALYALATTLVIGLAYGVGTLASRYFNNDSQRLYLSARRYATVDMLSRMNSVSVGDQLSDHTFRLVDGDSVRLSRIVTARSLIFFLDPTCPLCLGQAEMIARLARTESETRRFFFVTMADQDQCEQLQNALGGCLILRDIDGSFHGRLKVHSSPFSILVNGQLRIDDIVSGELLEHEIIQIARS